MTKIEISRSSKIGPLIEEYPFILGDLIKFSSKLKRFNNPILRKTIGKRATLVDVSKLGEVDLDALISVISESLSKNTTHSVIIKEGDTLQSGWQNARDRRKDILKSIVLELHEGGDLASLQERFKEELGDIDSSEIAEMEQSLINSGELTAEQITKLCDLHVGIFQETLDTHVKPETVPGHPIHTYHAENDYAMQLVAQLRENYTDEVFSQLTEIKTHFTRLQNQLFPILEQVGFTAPTAVMWAKHDEIRDMLNAPEKHQMEEILLAVEDMVFKEENILFPTALEKLNDAQWAAVRKGEEEIGYAWVTPGTEWQPVTPETIHGVSTPALTLPSENEVNEAVKPKNIKLDTGSLSPELINLMLTKLPLDLSFIGADDEVLYYSDTPERIFPRSAAVIGRKVQNCHPPKSQHIVTRILDAFKDGSKDQAEFWIELGGKFIHIEYFAIRDKTGKYVGTLEVSQDATHLRSLQGQQRLLEWDAKN